MWKLLYIYNYAIYLNSKKFVENRIIVKMAAFVSDLPT